ncbi:sugar transferase [Eubacteriales bacterium OttesenSCG-928-A19]|nr:sugar transferase [Eubacteriales bacterium OttesenSCG-928-A19]
MYKKYIKRILDIVLSFCALIVLSPIYALIAIWIKLDSKGPVLFRQKRIGKHKKPFNILKFRTMGNDTPHDIPTHMLGNPEQWITRAGRVLRKTSLDELPQVWQIFIGKMSLIGPRPALWNQKDLIAERDKYGANDVRPGLTGWAQVNGRDELEIGVKAKLDGEYIANMSFGIDIRCFLMTISCILYQRGIVEGSIRGLFHPIEEAIHVDNGKERSR